MTERQRASERMANVFLLFLKFNQKNPPTENPQNLLSGCHCQTNNNEMFFSMHGRQGNGRLHSGLLGEYSRSSCLSQRQTGLHAQSVAGLSTARGWRLAAHHARRRARHYARCDALAIATYARLLSGPELGAIPVGRHAGRCHQLSRLHLGLCEIFNFWCSIESLYLVYMRSIIEIFSHRHRRRRAPN